MTEFKRPITKTDMMKFLGTIGYYRRFVENFSYHSSVLTPAVKAKAPGKVKWTPVMEEAFHNLKVSSCKFCILNVPLPADIFELHTDAAGVGIGGVLNNFRDGESLPVAFYSCQLRGAERRYSATELEALAVVETVRHFNHFLYGCSFVCLQTIVH